MPSQSGEELTQQYQDAQVAQSRAFLVEFLTYWPLLNWADLDATSPGWLNAVMHVIREYRTSSARLADSYYDRYREVEVPGVSAPPPTLVLPGDAGHRAPDPAPVITLDDHRPATGTSSLDRPRRKSRVTITDNRDPSRRRPKVTVNLGEKDRFIEKGLQGAGPNHIKHLTHLGQNDSAARSKVLVTVSGNAIRQVNNAGRDTMLQKVDADSVAQGWARVTRGPNTCAFCAMLASKGPNYRPYTSQATAGFLAHDNCHCIAVPVYTKDGVWPGGGQSELYRDIYYSVTKPYSGKDKARAFRREWDRLRREGRLPVAATA